MSKTGQSLEHLHRMVDKFLPPGEERNESLFHLKRLTDRIMQPIPVRLHCPARLNDGSMCGFLHVDEGEFATKHHHTHVCQRCGHTWRPAISHTVGVEFLPGFRNPTTDTVSWSPIDGERVHLKGSGSVPVYGTVCGRGLEYGAQGLPFRIKLDDGVHCLAYLCELGPAPSILTKRHGSPAPPSRPIVIGSIWAIRDGGDEYEIVESERCSDGAGFVRAYRKGGAAIFYGVTAFLEKFVWRRDP